MYKDNISIESCHEKTWPQGFQPGLIQTGLYTTKTGQRLLISDLDKRDCIIL